MIKVSIIIPVFNVADYIERCLVSVLNQTYSDIEILLIDDCGQDNSIELAESLVAKHQMEEKLNFYFTKRIRDYRQHVIQE